MHKNEIIDDVTSMYTFISKKHKNEFSRALEWTVFMWYKYIPFLMHPVSRFTVSIYQIILRELIRNKVLKPKKDFDYHFKVIDLWAKAILPFNETIERMKRVYFDIDRKIHPHQWMEGFEKEPDGLWDCWYCKLKRPCFLQKYGEKCNMDNGTYCHIVSALHFCKEHGKLVLDIDGNRFGIYEMFYFIDGRTSCNFSVLKILSESSMSIGISKGNSSIKLKNDFDGNFYREFPKEDENI